MHTAQHPHIVPHDVEQALYQISLRPIIANRCHLIEEFKGDRFKAAKSWFEYSRDNPTKTIYHWFGQFDPTVLPKEEERWAI